MAESKVARINPRAKCLHYHSAQVSATFNKNTDMNDPGKGWYAVTEEEALYLSKIRDGGSSDPHVPLLFDVMTQSEATALAELEHKKLGIGGASNPIGGSPIQQAKIAELERQVQAQNIAMAAQGEQNVKILALLTQLTGNGANPALAAKLEGADPSGIGLALMAPVTMPETTADQAAIAAAAAPKAPAPAVPVKAPTPAAPPGKKPRVGGGGAGLPTDSNDLVSKMAERGAINPGKGDIDTGDGASAELG